MTQKLKREPYQSRRAVVAWCFYDWANSSFSSVVTTFIFAAYFTQKIAINPIVGTKLWGSTIAISGIIIALLSPVFGAIADYYGQRKPWLLSFTLLSVIASAGLWSAKPEASATAITLFCVIVGTIGLEIAMVFYNALLPSLASRNYLGRISGWSWGLGYLGGLTCLVIALFFFIEHSPRWLNAATAEPVRICGPLVAVWFLFFSLPLFIWVRDIPRSKLSLKQSIFSGVVDLKRTLRNLPKQQTILRFLIAHMIYIDGLNTLFAFGGIYAAGTFGMNIDEVIKFGIAMNVSAGLGAGLFAWVDDYIGSKPTIMISLIAIVFFGCGILLVHNKELFWILALFLSLFFGPVQSASRSLMARIAPPEHVTEMFGLFALSGKVTTFIGPWIFGIMTFYFMSQRAGMAALLVLFVIGGVLMSFVKTK